ncbi:6660_t:CDS:1, partial [Racocetra persica]
ASGKKVHSAKSSPPAATPTLKSYNGSRVGPEVNLDDLIDGYLEDLDTWLPEPKNTCPPKIEKKE